jgi:hypothetical protein
MDDFIAWNCIKLNEITVLYLSLLYIMSQFRENASHIWVIPQKDKSKLQLEFLGITYKVQFNLAYNQCGT